MRKFIAIILPAVLVLAGLSAAAQSAETDANADLSVVEQWQADPTTVFDAADVDLDAFQWIARPVIVFANTTADPSFSDQMALLQSRPDILAARDVLIVTDTDPKARTPIRLKLRPRGFMLAVISKDGSVALRKPLPWDVRELTRTIDKMPLRQRELQERRIEQ